MTTIEKLAVVMPANWVPGPKQGQWSYEDYASLPEDGHYYAHPGNRFWGTIYDVGLTPRRYEPSEFRALMELGIGFTDLSKSHAGMDHQISVQSVDVLALRAKVKKYRPRTIAFTSKRPQAFSTISQQRKSRLAGSSQRKGFQKPSCFRRHLVRPRGTGHWSLGAT